MVKPYKPFIKPSVLHPHIVHETGLENPQHMYEASSDIFAAIGKDPLRGVGDATVVTQESTGVIGFIKDHPILTAIAALGIGAAGFALISGGRKRNPDETNSGSAIAVDDEGNDIIDGEVISSSVKSSTKRQQPSRGTNIQLALPPPSFANPSYSPHYSYYVPNPAQEPIIIKSKDQPPVTISMPSERGVEVSAPGFGTSTVSGSGTVKKRRRRRKPDRVQIRDGTGKFTSTTVKRTAADLSGYAAKK